MLIIFVVVIILSKKKKTNEQGSSRICSMGKVTASMFLYTVYHPKAHYFLCPVSGTPVNALSFHGKLDE